MSKSSLTAGLFGLCVRLVADDLLAKRALGDLINVLLARPAMQQHHETAALVVLGRPT